MEGVSKLFRTSGKRGKRSSTLPEELRRRFSLAEMKIATNNFDDKLFIGQGSYGKVYKGLLIDDCSCTINVAIKCVTFDRLRTELPLACQLRPSRWFSQLGPSSLSKALIKIESAVVGTYGYADPVFVENGEVTDKSDVYSFGVVLLEVLSGRKASQRLGVDEQPYLANWDRKCKREGTINKIIDPYLMGKIAPECFKKYVDIATSCVQNKGKNRPTIGEVEVILEHALELQKSADATRKDVDPSGDHYNYPIVEYTCSASPPESEPEESVADSDSTTSA